MGVGEEVSTLIFLQASDEAYGFMGEGTGLAFFPELYSDCGQREGKSQKPPLSLRRLFLTMDSCWI